MSHDEAKPPTPKELDAELDALDIRMRQSIQPLGELLKKKPGRDDLEAVTRIVETLAPKSDFAAVVDAINRLVSKEEFNALSAALNSFATRAELVEVSNQLTTYIDSRIRGVIEDVLPVIAYLDGVKEQECICPVTSVDVLALNATPRTLLGAPGVGKSYEIKRAKLKLDFNTTPYTVGASNDLSIEYETSGQVLQVETTGFMDQSQDESRNVKNTNSLIAENEAVILTVLTGELTGGDSPLEVDLKYKIVDAT
jgi:hypothetical protein